MTERITYVVGAMTVASLVYAWVHSREGRVRRATTTQGGLSSEDLGALRGLRATLVQFSTDTCAKCPPTAALLKRVAESVPGVRHVEIDAIARLDLVRRFDVLRTPTILVLGKDGLIVARMSGTVSERHARDALHLAPPLTTDYSI